MGPKSHLVKFPIGLIIHPAHAPSYSTVCMEIGKLKVKANMVNKQKNWKLLRLNFLTEGEMDKNCETASGSISYFIKTFILLSYLFSVHTDGVRFI